jgi:hypothetical protein
MVRNERELDMEGVEAEWPDKQGTENSSTAHVLIPSEQLLLLSVKFRSRGP